MDTLRVSKIEAECFSQPWSRDGFLSALKGRENIFLVCEREGEVFGYCGMYGAGDEGEITNVAVISGKRRNGAGRSLILDLAARSHCQGIKTIFLEVRESNFAAISLYESCGFVKTGIRKRFYKMPDEDAVTMTLEV